MQRLKPIIIKVTEFQHGLILSICVLRRLLEIVESQPFVDIEWQLLLAIMDDVVGEKGALRVEDAILVEEKAGVQLCGADAHFCELHVYQGGLEYPVFRNQLMGFFQALGVLADVGNMHDEGFGGGAALVSSQTCEVHDGEVIGSKSMALFCCLPEVLICLRKAEFDDLFLVALCCLKFFTCQVHRAQVVSGINASVLCGLLEMQVCRFDILFYGAKGSQHSRI